MKVISLALLGVLTLAITACSRVTVEDLHARIHVGSTASEVQACLEEFDLPYEFVERDDSNDRSWRFPWKSKTSQGFYDISFPEISYIIVSYNAYVYIEIGSDDKVRQILVETAGSGM